MKDIKVLNSHQSAVDAYNSCPGRSDSFEEAAATLMAIESVIKDDALLSVTKTEEKTKWQDCQNFRGEKMKTVRSS